MIDIAAIAAAHGISAEELTAWIAGRGWDMAKWDAASPADKATAAGFLAETFGDYARQIAGRAARAEARRAAEAARKPAKTAAARAHPDAACYKCDGAGRILGFSHVANGDCFACGGSGVRRVRRAA